MRLKLSVERHLLPPVKTIWPLTVAQQSWTIAQLLEHINQTFPLEGDHWGLEDYIVTLAGFECIHHHEVSTVCKDEDELVIRPLQTVEHRARTLSGRHQISENGRHLIDGVAFGKPALRGPERPDVRIPPRKRRKIDEAEEQDEPTVLLLENGLTTTTENNEVDEDSEDDSDFAEAEDSESEESDSVEDEDDEEGNEDVSESDSDGSSEDDSSSSDSSESDDSSVAAQKTLKASDNPKTVKFQDQQTVEITPAQQRNALDALKAAYEPPTPPRGLPFQGSTMTKDRNNRRRLKSRLNWLKQQGELPETATFADLATYDGTSASRIDETAELARRQKALLEAIASGGIDVNDKQLLSTQPADSVDDDEPPEQMSSKHPPVDSGAEVAAKPTSAPTSTIPAALIPAAVTRRAKLDLAGSKRLLFGSLGVKVPTTDADKDKTRSKLANGNGVKKAAIPEVTQPVQQAVEDWQSKINLSAVECWDEGVVLSAPSFPFVQHWDPQYPPRGKKRKRQPSYVETYDKYNITATGDYLDYDGTAEDDEYWEEGALLGDDAESDEQDFDGFDEAVDDGFPPVPDDINTCQELAEADAAVGDFVVYTTMDCSAATGWKPAFLMKTIKLLEKGDGRWKIQMAQRDLPAKEYDDDGQRVFKKFEMSEETEDDAIERFMAWEEFGAAPRLLSRSA